MKLQLKDKQVLVLGLGDTGLSVLRWLARQGADLSVADTRATPPGMDTLKIELPEVKIVTGAFQSTVFNSADLIVVSPGVPLNTPEIQGALLRGVPVVGDVELLAQQLDCNAQYSQTKVIGITGANGKTTVTTLVGEMCKAAGLNTVIAGNIGLPVLDILSMDIPDVIVLELSSFQLETTHSLNMAAATVLNVTEDHMERYASFADYAAAKARIFAHAQVKVVNREDSYSSAMVDATSKAVSFGLNMPVNQEDFGLVTQADNTYLAQGALALLPLNEMKLRGLHNAANGLAALALCRAIDIDFEPLLSTLKTFKGLPHRVEWVANIGEVDFYDDSKGTNVGATCAAIAGMTKNGSSQKVVLIAGGDGKGQDFSPLLNAVQANARAVVLIGRDAPAIEQALVSSDIPRYFAVDLPEAVNIAYKVAHQGDAVLLSPACASFDMFKNYGHRAEVFIDSVQLLQTNQQALTKSSDSRIIG
ncbi:MAG: UDP-N-acetylmuramoyl-L-alanine--D-glutamate ligase [Methylophilaceae bacterium]|nr:UDP-N-acetylmuramoyl-L-alanine--D-glutamate ligase [Methylophilaceae bacterium]